LNVKDLLNGFALEAYESVIVGASIHMGEHEEYVRDFVETYRETLEGIPSAFFSQRHP
jgi:menaquinone-dependent protoporphyrinogen oxidase